MIDRILGSLLAIDISIRITVKILKMDPSNRKQLYIQQVQRRAARADPGTKDMG